MVPAKSWQRPEILEDGFVAFSSKAVQVLKEVLSQNTNACIMLTTSHKSRFSHSEWIEIFQRRGLNVNQLNSLVENTELLSRKEEILNWFNSFYACICHGFGNNIGSGSDFLTRFCECLRASGRGLFYSGPLNRCSVSRTPLFEQFPNPHHRHKQITE